MIIPTNQNYASILILGVDCLKGPMIMMFHSRELNNKINNLHERALRIVIKTTSQQL